MKTIRNAVALFLLFFLLPACKGTDPLKSNGAGPTGYQGQPPSPVVSTTTKPVQRQWRGTWALADSTVFFSNGFQGARLNGVAHDGNDRFTVWITAENTPINVSPWYSFQVWGSQSQEITITLSYQDSRSRYYPKISRDGIHFTPLDSLRFTPIHPGEGLFGIRAAPESVELRIPIDQHPTWVSAQELYPSSRVGEWVDSLSQKSFAKNYEIGRSREDRPLRLLEINAGDSKKSLVIISRQHPPEVTGFLAMKSFIETICGDTEQARTFRKYFTVFTIPLMNPDGVDNGHWRHNMGGIDLNRDWENFNQPETRAVRDFLLKKRDEGHEFVFGADFHSTWDDIYYPLDTTVTGDKGKIVFDWIDRISERLPQKRTNVKASDQLSPTMVSRTYFFVEHGMPAIVFELGDNTPRPFLAKKGKVAAEELMRLLLRDE
ncbi:MAG: M14 family metallopeptidase [Flavobacteriaceae bacterium]